MTNMLKFLLVICICFVANRPVSAQAHFLRGNVNRDGAIDLSDSIAILGYLFLGDAAVKCLDAADVDASNGLDIADVIRLLNFLFLDGNPPAFPFPRIDGNSSDGGGLGCFGPCSEVTGDVTVDTRWTADKCYQLQGPVIVRAPATLHIEPGVTVLAASAMSSILIISRGARLEADGSPTLPIIFTSDQPVGNRGDKSSGASGGDWRGIVIAGRSDNNISGKEAQIEAMPIDGGISYGANPPITEDSSGVLRYVRIEYAGEQIVPDNINREALRLYSVGSGTEIDHLMLKNSGEGIGIYGGTVNLRHVISIGNQTDFRIRYGWNGAGQYWIGQHTDRSAGGSAMVIANSEFSYINTTPLTHPVISNVTFIGEPQSEIGLHVLLGAGAIVVNGIVTSFPVAGLDIDNAETTHHNPNNGELMIDYNIFYSNGLNGIVPFRVDQNPSSSTFNPNTSPLLIEDAAHGYLYTTLDCGTTVNSHNQVVTAFPLTDPLNLDYPDYRPKNEALNPGLDPMTLGLSFDAAPYRGAVPPLGKGDDWTKAPWVSYLRK